jgi:hypothetical protein
MMKKDGAKKRLNVEVKINVSLINTNTGARKIMKETIFKRLESLSLPFNMLNSETKKQTEIIR